MFWKRRSSDEGPESERPSEDTRGDLAPVRIFTIYTTIEGWVDLAGQRLSDVLNLEDLLSVSPVRTPLDSDWFALEREEMLLLVPPAHVSDRALRPHRVKRPILVLSGHYVVRGLVHMIAGIALDPFLARSRQYFLPLTEARVTSTERPEVDEQHPALLVNVRSAQPLQLEVVE